MNLVTVKELYRNTDAYIDQTIEVGGWVRNIRPVILLFLLWKSR